VSLRVEDSGAGIAPEFLPFVFDRFRQGDSRSTRTHGGLGLGLAIAQHLVEQHHGEIRARSDGVGKGTTLSLRLPIAATAGREVCHDVPPVDVEVRLDNLELLVVDDQRDSREMLAALLEERGATVAQSDSADSASRYLASRPVHLVIADIAMPRVNGYEFIRQLRSAGNRTPAIAVTAFARSDDRQHALEAGYAAYLCKPIDARQLARTVRDLVLDSVVA
jgi:CheY-like chemotaxis protein